MLYQPRITRRAQKELRSLPTDIRRRLQGAISALAEDPRPHGSKRLRGDVGYAIRVGNYRVIYDIDEDTQTVTVLRAGHRGRVYRRL